MSASVLNNQQFAAVAVVIAAGLGYLYYKRKTIVESVNPLSRNNVAYKSVNAVGEVLTGDDDFSLGVKIWEWMNPQAMAREAELTKTVTR
jgi:hypothetical protein